MAEAAGLNSGPGGTMFRIGGGHIFIGVELANDALVEAVLGSIAGLDQTSSEESP